MRTGRYTADEIRTARLTMGLSQPAFAKRLGVSTGSIRNWEQGRTSPGTLAADEAVAKVIAESSRYR